MYWCNMSSFERYSRPEAPSSVNTAVSEATKIA